MADPPVPPPADPKAPAPNQPAPENPADPAMHALNQSPLAAPQIIHQPALNWSHFKPEFSGRPEEDVEVHLCTNDWMETHYFQEGVNVQRFCLPMVREARLWYESPRPYSK